MNNALGLSLSRQTQVVHLETQCRTAALAFEQRVFLCCCAGDLYLAAMDAINPINPNALFMVKGADQTIYTTNGGQGFVTDQQLITAAQCSNPNAFFRSLLSKSYSTQVS